jgi:hypothetical protein
MIIGKFVGLFSFASFLRKISGIAGGFFEAKSQSDANKAS